MMCWVSGCYSTHALTPNRDKYDYTEPIQKPKSCHLVTCYLATCYPATLPKLSLDELEQMCYYSKTNRSTIERVLWVEPVMPENNLLKAP